jgi:hypothetical protein
MSNKPAGSGKGTSLSRMLGQRIGRDVDERRHQYGRNERRDDERYDVRFG